MKEPQRKLFVVLLQRQKKNVSSLQKLTFQGADEHVSCIQKSRAATVAALRLHAQSVQYGRHQLSLGVRQLVAVIQIGCVATAQVLQLRQKIRDRT